MEKEIEGFSKGQTSKTLSTLCYTDDHGDVAYAIFLLMGERALFPMK